MGSPTRGGLPNFAQKTLLEQIENSNSLDLYYNQEGENDQHIRPLLESSLIYLVILVMHDENTQETL